MAYNGEESGRQGSPAFAKHKSDKYEYVSVINIDSVGIDANDGYLVLGDDHSSRDLKRDIAESLSEEGLDIDLTQHFGSDHMSYNELGISAITIGQNILDVIHTESDSIESLDFDSLDSLIDILAAYLTRNVEYKRLPYIPVAYMGWMTRLN